MGIRFLSGILRGLARPVWIAAFGVLFVASYFVLISAGSAAVVYFAALALGVSIGLFWPSQAAAVHSYAPGSQGAVMGLYTLFCTLGVAVFASVIGALGDRVGLRWALLVAVAGELIFVVMHVVFCAGTARKRRDSSRGQGGTRQEAQKAASEDRD
ncbi:MAG: MFS transporter [Planctomycetia bacterium]|nr:MFS transporter [Planctomycetia bacterium]